MSRKIDDRMAASGERLPPAPCPACHEVQNAATCIDDDVARPKPNDFSVCINCGEVLLFNDDMTVRRAELNDLMNVPADVRYEIGVAQEIVRRQQ